MCLQVKLWQVMLSLLVFFPLALIPSSGNAALLASRESSPHPALSESPFLGEGEAAALEVGQYPLQVGGQEQVDNPLASSDVIAIILTALALGAVIGFVIQQQD